MGDELLTPEVLALVGKDWPPVTYGVDQTGIRMWARAIGFTDPVFYDEGVARSRGYTRMPAPPGFLGVARLGVESAEPGPPIRGLHPELNRSVNGGTEIEYRTLVLSGDELVAVTRITDVKQRAGSLGRMLIFSRETTYRRDGEIVAILRAKVINY